MNTLIDLFFNLLVLQLKKTHQGVLKNRRIRVILGKNIIDINVEVQIVTNDKSAFAYDESCFFCSNTKDNIMVELKVNLEQATNYLIQLFYKTGKKYSCARSKLGKLLTVVSFVYARNGKRLFNESICKYDNCGTAINALKDYLDREVYIRNEYYDCLDAIEEDFDETVAIPKMYSDIEKVPDDVKDEIEKVFRKFGAYSAYDIGCLIISVINLDGVIKADEEIDLEKIHNLQISDYKELEQNELLKYLFGK